MKLRNALGLLSCVLSVVLFGSAAHAASTITGTTTLTYQAAAGINNNLSVTVSGSNFLFTDSGDSITFNSVTTAAAGDGR